MNRRTAPKLIVWMFSFLLMGLFTNAHAYSAEEWGQVINLSGKQRMLTQKMSKEALLLALDVNKQDNVANIEKSAALFNKTLKGLQQGDASLQLVHVDNARVQRQLDKVNAIWQPFYAEIQKVTSAAKSGQPIPKAAIDYIMSNNETLLKQMNRAVRQFESLAQTEGLKSSAELAVTINLAGKQRMLSQKMSKYYYATIYGYEAENSKASLLSAVELFERTLVGLEKGDDLLKLKPTNNVAANKQLKIVEKHWQVIKPMMQKVVEGAKASSSDINNVAKENLIILKEMNKAVSMFVKQV